MDILTIDFAQLWKNVSKDCELDTPTVKYVLKRLNKEGLKFWTVALPKLATCVLRGLELGNFKVARNELHFTYVAWQGCSLRYFRSLLGRIFCSKTGDVLPSADAGAIASLRQILEYAYKISFAFTQDEKVKHSEKFEKTQEELSLPTVDVTWVETLRRSAETNYPYLFKASPSDILAFGPRFGPGSFAESGGRKPHIIKMQKQSIVGTCSREMRPYSGYFKPYPAAPVRIKLVRNKRVSELVLVPKDSRGPRVIVKEPLHGLPPQMAFFAWASESLERGTHNRINFARQDINRTLARTASVSGSHATLDLKDASDMVRIQVIKHIFRYAPGIRWLLQKCRSTDVKIPGSLTPEGCPSKSLRLHSVAGMGSGFTFPLLAFLCHLSICTNVKRFTGLKYRQIAKQVYVYGDDIIVPTGWAAYAEEGLRRSGLKVNLAKSFVTGKFRESCGGDYYNGIDVAPVRLRLTNSGLPPISELKNSLKLTMRDLPDENPNSRKFFTLQLVAHTHELRKAGMNFTADYIEGQLEKVIPMPFVGEGSPVLGKFTEDTNLIVSQGVWSPTSSCNIVKGYKKTPYVSALGGHAAIRCPYKYLADRIRPSSFPVLSLILESGGTAFEEIVEPRNIKLKLCKTTVSELLPAQEKPVLVGGTIRPIDFDGLFSNRRKNEGKQSWFTTMHIAFQALLHTFVSNDNL